MKRKLGKTTVNPLDLLLDTTSNVFGSMILIALMISLFAGTPSANNALKPGELNSEAIERQIKNAEKDASVLAAELSKQKAQNGDKEGARELAAIENDVDSIKRQLEKAKQTQRDGIQASVVDYGAAAAGATKEAAATEEDVARRQNAIASAEQQMSQLKARLQEMQAKVQKERAKKVQRLSLPRERETEQKAFWVIIVNNEIFPAKIIDYRGEMSPFSGITVVKKDGGSELWMPVRGRGYSMPGSRNDVVEQIRRLSRDRYVACLVFPDSIQTFRDFEEIVHGLGRDMGWEPCDREEDLLFSASGSMPKPQ
jgi:signal transduction protein with GAF and PtsI domain